METIILQNNKIKIVTSEEFLILRYGDIRDTNLFYVVEFLGIIFIAIILMLAFNAESFMFMAGSLFLIVIWLVKTKITEISFNKKTGELIKKHFHGGIVLKSECILKKYSKFKYSIKFKEMSDGEDRYSGYFLIAASKYNSYDIVMFNLFEDLDEVEKILSSELGIEFQQP